MTVFVVTSGEYSDYGIVAVFSTREKADAAKAEMERYSKAYWDREPDDDEDTWGGETYDHVQVEAYEVDPPPRRVKVYRVWVDDDGREILRRGREILRRTTRMWSWEDMSSTAFRDGALGQSRRGYNAALKSARDKLTEWKAREAGIAP